MDPFEEYEIDDPVMTRYFLDPSLRDRGKAVKDYFHVLELAKASHVIFRVQPNYLLEKKMFASYDPFNNTITVDAPFYTAGSGETRERDFFDFFPTMTFVMAHELFHFKQWYPIISKYTNPTIRSHVVASIQSRQAKTSIFNGIYSIRRGIQELNADKEARSVALEVNDPAKMKYIERGFEIFSPGKWSPHFEKAIQMKITPILLQPITGIIQRNFTNRGQKRSNRNQQLPAIKKKNLKKGPFKTGLSGQDTKPKEGTDNFAGLPDHVKPHYNIQPGIRPLKRDANGIEDLDIRAEGTGQKTPGLPKQETRKVKFDCLPTFGTRVGSDGRVHSFGMCRNEKHVDRICLVDFGMED